MCPTAHSMLRWAISQQSLCRVCRRMVANHYVDVGDNLKLPSFGAHLRYLEGDSRLEVQHRATEEAPGRTACTDESLREAVHSWRRTGTARPIARHSGRAIDARDVTDESDPPHSGPVALETAHR